jgi:hypothetical protein
LARLSRGPSQISQQLDPGNHAKVSEPVLGGERKTFVGILQ